MVGSGIWSGTVSFSLVAIPVRLVTAVSPGRISFHLLHKTDYAPLKRAMFCPSHGRTVDASEIVKGYELTPGFHLPFTSEELESVSPERSRTIEILQFINFTEIDPVYFDHPYYLAPAKGGEKAYALLAEAMRQTGKAGLARFVLGEREHLVAILSRKGTLALVTLHYFEEVHPDQSAGGDIERSEARKKAFMAGVEKMTGVFDPARYSDARRERITALLERKALETQPVEPPMSEEEDSAGPPDLMEALAEAMRDIGNKR